MLRCKVFVLFLKEKKKLKKKVVIIYLFISNENVLNDEIFDWSWNFRNIFELQRFVQTQQKIKYD